MRDPKLVLCSCGGTVEDVETTLEEERAHGCGRIGCCVWAFQCEECQTRFLFILEAPEIGYC